MKSTTGPRPPNKAAENVNLGLSALLDAHVKGGNANGSILVNGSAQTQAGKDAASEAAESKPEIPQSPLSKALQMAANRRWNELADYSEVLLAANPEQSEMRVLWALAQFRLKRMPLSILAGPLESASKKMLSGFENRAENSELKQEKDFLYATLHDFGKELLAHNESALALVFLERAFGISNQGRGSLLECIDANLKRLSEKRGKRNEQADKKELAKLQLLKASLPGETVAKNSDQAQISAASNKSQVFLKLVACSLGAGFLLLMLAGAYYYLDFWPNANTSRIALTFTVNETLPDIARAPSLRPVGTLGNLDGLLYQLDRKDNQNTDKAAALANQQTTEQLPAAFGSQGKEVVNTTFPVKESSTREMSGSKTLSSANGAKYNRSNNQLERNSTKDALRSRADLRLVEIENFSAPVAYEMVRRSWVMSKPSELATPISELSSGERVWVVAKVGEWLKLRSKEGTRIGYIRSSTVRSLGNPN